MKTSTREHRNSGKSPLKRSPTITYICSNLLRTNFLKMRIKLHAMHEARTKLCCCARGARRNNELFIQTSDHEFIRALFVVYLMPCDDGLETLSWVTAPFLNDMQLNTVRFLISPHDGPARRGVILHNGIPPEEWNARTRADYLIMPDPVYFVTQKETWGRSGVTFLRSSTFIATRRDSHSGTTSSFAFHPLFSALAGTVRLKNRP